MGARSSIFLFCLIDSITSWYLAGSGISWLFCSQTSIDFLYALYFIPVPQLGTFVGFTNLLGLSLFPMTTGNNERPSKLVKPTKVPSWGTGMKYKAYKKSIEVWEQNNQDMLEPARYQEVIESMKQNKNIEDLARYAGEHMVGKLDTTETQTIKEILQLLLDIL